MSSKNSSTGIVITITAITLICKILGFLKNSVLAYYYGTSSVVDAYVMTFSIGTITSGWIAGLIGNFTPKFKELEAKESRNAALLFSSQALNLILLLAVVLIIILEIFAPTIVGIVAPGFKGETLRYTVHFFRLYCLSVFFYTIFRFSQEFLNCNQNHLAAVAPDLLMSSICIAAIIISHYIGADYLILGYVAAIFLQSVVSHLSTRKLGFRFKVTSLWNSNLKSLMMMAVPIFLSDTLANINNLIDKVFASGLESGIVAALDYANTMKEFAYQTGTIAIVTMIFPVVSKLWAENDISAFRSKILQGLDFFSALYIPVIVGIIAVGDIAICIVFQRGQFTQKAAVVTATAFVIYSINLIAMAYRCVFLKAFYAMKKTKYILAVSFMNVGLNTLFNFLLVKKYGYIGLTTATTVAALVCSPLYFWFFKKAIPGTSYRSFLQKFLKCLIASAGMGIGVLVSRYILEMLLNNTLIDHLIVLATTALIGIALYGTLGRLLGIDEINELSRTVKSRLRNMRI